MPSFEDIEVEFLERVNRIVWCSVATIDRRGRPRSRILHPIWEGQVGWIATGRQSFKAKHLAANPYVSLSYWDQEHQQVYADCKADWCDDDTEKRRVWELYKNAPPPMGYDPQMIWPNGPGEADFGLLRLTPWRIELYALKDMVAAAPPKVWRAAELSPASDVGFLNARPNLAVRDVATSIAFYRDNFGFDVIAEMGDPLSFALLRRDGAEVALRHEEGATKSGCYIYIRGVEAFHDQCKAAGLKIVYPLTQEPWDVLNFVVEDPDGHAIAIGERKASPK